MKLRLLLGLLLITYLSQAQNLKYQSLLIDDELSKNADAVVRLDELVVDVEDVNLMRSRTRQVITVLNEKGNGAVNAYQLYEKDDRIDKLEVIVYDALGNEVRKIKKKDFIDASAVGGGTLYSDSRVKYLNYTPISYPYTIEFVCDFTTENTAFMPTWYFLGNYRTSVEKSKFQVNINPGISFRHLEYGLEGYDIKSEKTANSLLYEAENLTAIKSEIMAPPLSDFGPKVRVALDNFHLEGVDGKASSWNELGKWIYDELLVGQDAIDPETVSHIQSLVKGVEDPQEIIDIVYNYVQSNTRYISVQLGIGGWMPISASEVDRVKYGDCKGLTNYTKALLKAVGIDSYYTVVYGDRAIRDMEEDLVCMQGNHVILNVPLEDGDIWLECTSQVIPSNFLGGFTDNRKVLRVTPDGGEIIKTPEYSASENLLSTVGTCELDAEGNIASRLQITSSGVPYNKRFRLERMDDTDVEKFYKNEWDYVNNIDFSQPRYSNDRRTVTFKEEIEIEASEYASIAGDQILFAPNVLSRQNEVPKRYRKRTLEFQNQRGSLDEAEYIIQLPEGYGFHESVEKEFDTEFGTYKLKINSIDEKSISYKRSFLLKSWRLPKEKYNDYRDFRKNVARLENSKIVLSKI